jgi:hypothetical protein
VEAARASIKEMLATEAAQMPALRGTEQPDGPANSGGTTATSAPHTA